MKRISIPLAIALAVLLPPALRSEPEKRPVPNARKLIAQQEKLIDYYEEFLDLCAEFAGRHKTEDPDAAERALAALQYAKGADVPDKMRIIAKFIEEGGNFDACAECLNVDTEFEKIMRLLLGERVETILDYEKILREAKELRDKMGRNDAAPWDTLAEAGKWKEEINAMIEKEKGLLGDLNAGGKTPEEMKRTQDDLGKAAGKMVEAMSGGAPGAAGAMKDAAADMGSASEALGQMGENGAGGGNAADAMRKALANLRKAGAELDRAAADAKDKIEKSGDDLQTLFRREKEIGQTLSELRKDAARIAGQSSKAADKFGRAEAKTRSAAGKIGKASAGGEDCGAGGASGDQADARAAVDKAIEDLAARLETLKTIKSLMEVEKSLKEMIEIQKGINAVTESADRERSAFIEKNPGRRFEFGRSLRLNVFGARAKESDLALRAGAMADLLRGENKFVFSKMLDIIRDDMAVVVEKLDAFDVGEETLMTEADILRELERLHDSVRKDHATLKEKYNTSGGGSGSSGGSGGGGNKGGKLPTLAEVKLLRAMQLEVHFKTSQLADVHNRRIAAIEADGGLSPAEKERMKRSAEEQKIALGKRLAGKQSQIEALTRELIDGIRQTTRKK